MGVQCKLYTVKGKILDQEKDAINHSATVDKTTVRGNDAIHLWHSEDSAKKTATSLGWPFIQFGVYSHDQNERIVNQVLKLPPNVMTQIKRIVVSVGSGVTLVGIVHGLKEYYKLYPHNPKIKVVGVRAARDARDPTEFLNSTSPTGTRMTG